MHHIRRHIGFTLMELVIVLLIIGILFSAVVPKYIYTKKRAEDAAKEGMAGVVKGAYAIALSDLEREPTIKELVSYLQGDGVSETSSGIIVPIKGLTNPIVRTYSDKLCNTPTTDVNAVVQCVGTIA